MNIWPYNFHFPLLFISFMFVNVGHERTKKFGRVIEKKCPRFHKIVTVKLEITTNGVTNL